MGCVVGSDHRTRAWRDYVSLPLPIHGYKDMRT
jgi:hypothetical protein